MEEKKTIFENSKKKMFFYETYGLDKENSFIDELNSLFFALINKLRIRNNANLQKNNVLLRNIMT